MGDDNAIARTEGIDRRRFVAGLGTGVAAGLAGVADPASGRAGATSASVQQERMRPIEGVDTAPDSLNPLATSSAYSFEILDQIYTTGTVIHPETLEFNAWAFEDWTLAPDNIGSSEPTLVGQLRDDLAFSDGESLTAEDVQFTVEYVTEQEPAGTISASQFASVESVEVDSADGTAVSYFFSEPNAAWFTEVLGNYVLPSHVWSDVSNSQEYTPRNSQAGVVGAGPMTLRDFNWENWFELSMRPAEEIPFPGAEYVDWLDPEGPFLDGLRVEVFGSRNAVDQALLNDNIDVAFESASVDRAVQATENENLEVVESQDDGWNHQSFNTRRVPLDDPAFRQLLVMLDDKTWTVEELKRGVGAERGTYATPNAYETWRPPEPGETGEFEGIPVEDLSFPGEAGTFQLSEEGVQEARDFLFEHDRARHDYSLGEATTDLTSAPDGMEIYVDGQPFTEAHTDNAGNGGQGPLEHSFNPPQEDTDEARIAQRWVGALQAVGIPVETQVQSFNSQLPKVYAQEDFDVFAMGWNGIGVNNDHYNQLFGSAGADLDGTAEVQQFNAMAYTGADDLIDEQRQLLEPEPRQPIVQQVLARIWADAPTDVTQYPVVLQPTSTAWTGWVQTVGGVLNTSTWLNLRPADG